LVGNSAFAYGGGAYSCRLTNCILNTNSTGTSGAGAYACSLINCTLCGNSAGHSGGGASHSGLTNCALNGNSAYAYGGGAYATTLTDCLVASNSVGPYTYAGGGGAYGGVMNNCTLTGNSATNSGGGAYDAVLNNCIVYYNNAPDGNFDSTSILNFCCTTPLPATAAGNFTNAPLFVNRAGGDFHLQPDSPCINAGNNAYVATTTDLDGNPRIVQGTVDMGAYEFQAPILYVNVNSTNPVSPYGDWSIAATNIQDAVNAATNGDLLLVTNGVYQFGGQIVYGAMSNRVAVALPITVESINGPAVTTILGYQVPGTTNGDAAVRCVYLTNGAVLAGFTLTNGATRAAGDSAQEQSGGGVWCASSSATVSNCIIAGNSATYFAGGAYQGTLTGCTLAANSATYAGGGAYQGTLTTCTLTGNSTVFGGGGGANATLLNCILTANSTTRGGGAGAQGGTLTNCTLAGNSSLYWGGGVDSATLYNCTLATNSANKYGGGSEDSTLYNCTLTGNSAPMGGGADFSTLTNCALVGNSAVSGGGAYESTINNCTLSNNVAADGGGVAYGILNDCVLVGNSATNGGGAYGADNGSGSVHATLSNCLLTGNSATNGGGAYYGTLNNCTICSNTASFAGGTYQGFVNNCIVYYNRAGDGNYDSYGSLGPGVSTTYMLNYCCTTPLPTTGVGNFTNAPLFVNPAAGNFRLQSNSPCINAGNNAYVVGSTDLDGNPRISGGTVDVGTYEFQNPASIISYAWLEQYGLATDGSADFADPDGDGMNNWQEWRAGTNPTNASSVLKMLSVAPSGPGAVVTWQSVSGINYYLQRSANPAAPSGFSSIQSNIVGQASSTSFTDPAAPTPGPAYYRVGVQP
jgi:hypothetical protein